MWRAGEDMIIGTDGGLKDGIGTIGVCMEMKMDPTINITMMSGEICRRNTLHSTREELLAQLTAEIIISRCSQLWGNEKHRDITMVCDSKSALSAVDTLEEEKWKSLNILDAEADTIMAIEILKQETHNITRIYKWVKSHQTDKDPTTTARRVNERADELATRCRENITEGLMMASDKLFIPISKMSLQINGTLISKDLKREIGVAMHDKRLKKFLLKKYGWTDNVFQNIDWTPTQTNLNRKPTIYTTAVIKLLHRWQPTNLRCAWYKRGATGSNCDLCGETEVQHHYMKCSDQVFKQARKNGWLKLKKALKGWDINNEIYTAMWQGCQSFCDDPTITEASLPPMTNGELQRDITCAWNAQSTIGWNHFMLGRISKDWRKCVHRSFENDEHTEGKTTGYLKALVSELWKYMLYLWQVRNDTVHGDNNIYSRQDIRTVMELVDTLFEKYSRNKNNDSEWLFEKDKDTTKKMSMVSIIAWIETVVNIFLVEDEEDEEILHHADHILRRMCVGSIFSESERE